jgi:hypothetical protein
MCKKRVCVVVVIALGLAGSASALQVIDDFEDGNLDIWDISEGQDGVAIGSDPLHPDNNCLIFSPETTTMRTPWGLPQGNAETLFYRLMYDMEPGGTVTLIFGPSDPIGTAWGNYYCIARMNSYGDSANVPDMDVATGPSGYTPVVQADLEPMRWYNVLFDIDTASRKYDVYIDDVLVFQGATFRSANSPPNLEYILLKTTTWSNNFANGKVYVDDIVIGGIPTNFPPVAYGPKPAHKSMHADTWVNLSWRAGPYAISHDVYIGDNFDDVNNGTESTFLGNQAETFLLVGLPGFAYPDGLVPGTTYYWRIDEVNETEPNSPWKGDVWSFSLPPKTAYFPIPADVGESVALDVELSWTAGYGAKLHTVYFGESFDEVDNAAGGLPQATTTYTPGTLKMAKTYYWRVDEFDFAQTHKGDVWSFTTEGAVGSPSPAKGTVDVTQTPVLTWVPGVFADTHEIYFGADAVSLELKGSGKLGSESFEPGQLEWNTTYYWRVNEANNANADSPWTSPLWSFTTANFLIIDDMEAYNDLPPDDPSSNRIFNVWIDGFGDPTNGSLVGYANPPFAEQTIVHSGNQSMPFEYDNAAGKSEATLTLTSNNDWTVKGVDRLTIWYRGRNTNTAETMYVTLNGSAGVDNDNPDVALAAGWTEWNIPLQAFADQGVNLSNVTSIALGLRSVTGGSGMLYFDDIRLCPPMP